MTEFSKEVENDTYDVKITEQAFICDNCGRMNMLSSIQPTRASYSVHAFTGREEWYPRPRAPAKSLVAACRGVTRR